MSLPKAWRTTPTARNPLGFAPNKTDRNDGAVGHRALPRPFWNPRGTYPPSPRLGRTRSCAEFERNVPFYETNPPFWRAKFCVSTYFPSTYVVCRAGLQVGSFWKTNPPEGCFRGVFVEKWARLWRAMPLGGVAMETSFPRSSPERNSGRARPEVGIDNHRRRVSIRGAGNGTTNKGR